MRCGITSTDRPTASGERRSGRSAHPPPPVTSDGAMWFLTGNGVGVVDPARLAGTRQTAPLLVESMLTDNHEQAPLADLELPPSTSTLQIDYTLLSLAPLSQVSFRYRLEGFDAEWIEAGTRRQAFYTNLSPGSYRFVVEAQGDESARRASAQWKFSILPRFYQTTWFGFACHAGGWRVVLGTLAVAAASDAAPLLGRARGAGPHGTGNP